MRETPVSMPEGQKPRVLAGVLWFFVMAVVAFGITSLLKAYVADAQMETLANETIAPSAPAPSEPSQQQHAQEGREQGSQPMPQAEGESEGTASDEQVPYHEQPMTKQEVADVLRQIKELRTQVKQIEKSAKRNKNAAATAALTELLAQLANHEKAIKNPTEEMTQREAVSAFWDARLWDEVNNVRRMIDLPRELKDIERALLRAEKTMKKPRVQKTLAEYLSYGEETLKKVRLAFDTAKTAFAAGDLEAAEDAVRDARDESYPGEVDGTYEMLSGLMDNIRRIKDVELRATFVEILQPAFDAMKESDFRESRQVLEDVNRQMYPLIDQAMRAPKKPSKAFTNKMQQLEKLLLEKYGDDPYAHDEMGR